ncbi:MAG: leucyl aminopeptidase [Bacteroidetes bacterium]|nr:leucyl aminopeptidase [Bacteroidota bacterium]
MIKITLGQKYSQGNVLIFTNEKNEFDASYFNKEELSYIKREHDAKRKTVLINQYHRWVIIQQKSGKDASKLEQLRKAGDVIAAHLNKHQQTNLSIISNKADEQSLAIAEGIALGNYQFIVYRKENNTELNSLKNVIICNSKLNTSEVAEKNILAEAVYRVRDLVNTPTSHQNAKDLANSFAVMGKESGFKTEIFNKAKIKALKMGGLLAVNAGSVDEPTFTTMEYKPAKPSNKKPYVLVGKGVVYDTGGLSIKPTGNSMDYMKCDMAGSAVVAGTMYAIAKMKLPIHIIGLTPATDNRPGFNAFAPGDVIHMMSGTSVEMLNSDAEGRMILADALHYAKQYNPELVCEFSTLTGAAAAAIGHYGIVCMGTANEKIKNGLKQSGDNTYERLVEFPFWEEYDELLKSDIADCKNIGGANAGAITAGRFLQKFTDYPYMHFDIAGPAFVKTRDSYRGKDATGIGVRLMVDFLSKKAGKK